VGCETFDIELGNLRGLLNHLKNKQQDEEKKSNDPAALSKPLSTNNVRIGSKELNILNEAEEKLPGLEEKIQKVMQELLKIPRLEDLVAKLNAQLKEMNLKDIIARLNNLQEVKMDK